MSKKTKGSPKVSFRCHSVLREMMILASERDGCDLGEWIRRAVIRSLGSAARAIDPKMGIGLGAASQEIRRKVSSLGGKKRRNSIVNNDLGDPQELPEK